MKQYEYVLICKTKGTEHTVLATAKTPDIARNQIAKAFSGYVVSKTPRCEFPPHQFCSEIDCSMCDIDDVEVAA